MATMIVSESDILVAALDRRLRVDAALPVDARGPIASGADEPRPPATPLGPSAAAASDAVVDRLPLGTNVSARIVAVPAPNHVVADIAGLVIAMSWPGSPVPTPGLIVSLRVLSHEPLLLFESALVDPAQDDDQTDTPTRLSASALRMSPGAGGSGPIRFDAPILEIQTVPLHRSDGSSAGGAAVTPGGSDRIPLDDVIVAQGARLADPSAASANPLDPSTTNALLPMVLMGPAWRGQDVELIVRRERADESFDNPVLDQWCGDLVIDLPRLGRVAGHLAWSMQGLRIRLEGDDHGTVASMNAATAELATALATVDLPVVSMSVSQPLADAATSRHV